MYQLVLASQSPRRADILRSEKISFTICSPNLSEILNENISLQVAVEALAQQKAEASVVQCNLSKLQAIIVLAADTMVSCEGRALGKPKNISEAREYLRLLSGREHVVWTGICLWNLDQGQMILDSDSTKVYFKKLKDEEIEKYLAGSDWQDKAGAYGIQSEGRNFVERIDGSYANVMGLPIEKVKQILAQNQWIIHAAAT